PFHLHLLYVDAIHFHKQDKVNRHVSDLLIQLLDFQSKRLLNDHIVVSLFHTLLALFAWFGMLLSVGRIILMHLLLIDSDGVIVVVLHLIFLVFPTSHHNLSFVLSLFSFLV